jgi:hypothetical protein
VQVPQVVNILNALGPAICNMHNEIDKMVRWNFHLVSCVSAGTRYGGSSVRKRLRLSVSNSSLNFACLAGFSMWGLRPLSAAAVDKMSRAVKRVAIRDARRDSRGETQVVTLFETLFVCPVSTHICWANHICAFAIPHAGKSTSRTHSSTFTGGKRCRPSPEPPALPVISLRQNSATVCRPHHCFVI